MLCVASLFDQVRDQVHGDVHHALVRCASAAAGGHASLNLVRYFSDDLVDGQAHCIILSAPIIHIRCVLSLCLVRIMAPVCPGPTTQLLPRGPVKTLVSSRIH